MAVKVKKIHCGIDLCSKLAVTINKFLDKLKKNKLP
jgi:hypothetical protein